MNSLDVPAPQVPIFVTVPYVCTKDPSTCPAAAAHDCTGLEEIHVAADLIEEDRDHVVHMATVLLMAIPLLHGGFKRSDLPAALAAATGYPRRFVATCVERIRESGIFAEEAVDEVGVPKLWNAEDGSGDVAVTLDAMTAAGGVRRCLGEGGVPAFMCDPLSERRLVRWERVVWRCNGARRDGEQCCCPASWDKTWCSRHPPERIEYTPRRGAAQEAGRRDVGIQIFLDEDNLPPATPPARLPVTRGTVCF